MTTRLTPSHIISGLRRLRRHANILFKRDNALMFRACRGIVHVGASTGQERLHYQARGLDVLWVEAIPEVFERLAQNIAGLPKQQAFQALVSDSDGDAKTFFVSSNEGMSSSYLPPKQHKEVWPQVTFEQTLSLTTTRLDTLFERERLDHNRYDGMVLDTQGSELSVLKGAGYLLRRFRFILVEAADFESYEGCCQVSELREFMMDNGFKEKRREVFCSSDVGSYFEILFENRASEN